MFQHILAGDTHKTTFQDTSYPASGGWTLKYFLNGPSTLTLTGTADVDAFDLVLSATQSKVLNPGVYTYSVRLSKDGESYTVSSGTVEVRPDPATTNATPQVAQRMVELIEKALTNQLTDGEALEAFSIAGRSLTSINRKELLQERSYWYKELERFKRASTGFSGIRQIKLNIGRI